MPKVSIIMPTYNGSGVIEKSIKSILDQTYTDFELIIVDDNGENTYNQKETYKIVSGFLPNDKIKYIVHKINLNGSAARNTGIKEASGSYIAFLDDDDCFYPDKIEKQVKILDNSSYGLVYGGLIEKYKNGKENVILPKKVDNFLYEYLAGKLFVCSSTIIVKKEVIDKIGLWDESFKRHQDMEFIVRIAARYNVGFIPEPCIIKEREDRNLPQNPEIVEKYRIHYLEKMRDYINILDENQRKDVYYFHMFSIGKAYIKNHKILKPIKIAMKSDFPIKMLMNYVKDAFKYAKNR